MFLLLCNNSFYRFQRFRHGVSMDALCDILPKGDVGAGGIGVDVGIVIARLISPYYFLWIDICRLGKLDEFLSCAAADLRI